MPKPTATKPTKSRPEPQRAFRPRPVSELVPDVGRATFRKFGFVQHSVVSRWNEIVGERYARISTPESIRFPQGKRADGVLTLTIAGAHAPMMQHLAPEIIERVNRFFGYSAINRVQIRHGEPARRAAPQPLPAPQPVPAELGDSLRDIADPELKAVLEALASGVAGTVQIPKLGRID